MERLPPEVTRRVDRFLPGNVRPLVYNPELHPIWIDDGRFRYRREGPGGASMIEVEAATGHRVAVSMPEPALPAAAPHERASPDGEWVLFRRGDDVWLRAAKGGAERRLTSDGEPAHSYGKSADANLATVTLARKGVALPPVALWSPDSRRILLCRLDERAVGDFPMVQHVPEDGSARPRYWPLKLALSGDTALPMVEYLIIEAASGRINPVAAGPLIGGVASAIERSEAWWSADSARVYVTDRDRLSRRLSLLEFDAAAGASRVAVEETADTFIDTNLSVIGRPNIVVLDRSGEVLWFSQRDGRAHLYLYDLATGALKGRVTEGRWMVRDVVRVDEAARQVWFLAGGVDPERDPTLRTLCRIGLDGTGFTVLTPEAAEHSVAMPALRMPRDHVRPAPEPGEGIAPDFRHFIHTHSTIDRLPVTSLRRADGSLVAVLEEASLDPALAGAWRWPVPFRVIAADGQTPLWGAMWLPSDFDPVRRYPVLDWIYPGPQRGQTPKGAFGAGSELARNVMPQAFAEIGCIVVNVDGRGTPLRDKAFHDRSYGRLDDPGCLEDHVATIRELARRHAYIDTGRVAIMGHSAGGYATVRAMASYPDFFRVGVSSAGNHDQRGYGFTWAEKHQGPVESLPDGTTSHTKAANKHVVDTIAGKLLLAYGEMDDNVHPALSLQLIDALVKADKDFELVVLPNEDHGSTTQHPYFLRKAMEFLGEHLGIAAQA